MRAKGSRETRSCWQTLVALAVILGLAAAATMQWLPWWLACYYLLCSGLTFGVYALDKTAAIRGQWRTPELRLQLLALLGGWPGALLAQQLLRHKLNKNSFLWVFCLMVLLNLAALYALMFAETTLLLPQKTG
jgi:uncharacterized membrane protein YsdA (DUF1294 family)